MKKRMIALSLAFLKLGFTAFGGPAAAYAMMRQEFVTRRKWISEETFFDLLGIANLVPGPNATEMAILIGYHHAGWLGLILAGASYVVPAMLIVLGFSWAYIQFGTLPALEGVLFGIKPVVVAILISAMWGMLKPRLKQHIGLGIVAAVFIAYLLGINPVILLAAGGLLMGLFTYLQHADGNLPLLLLWLLNQSPLHTYFVTAQKTPFNLSRLFLVFLKAGALMYGSGYVLLAFIHDDLVIRLGWLTNSQLVDAIAIGQVTPGPLSTTATFVGYLLGGVPAAILATLAMFLPSFVFVGVVYSLVNKIRQSAQFSGVLDGVNFAALGLMAGVTWEIVGESLVDPITAGIAMLTLFLLLRYKINAPWLIFGGGVVGFLWQIISG